MNTISKNQKHKSKDQIYNETRDREKILELARELYNSWEITYEKLQETYAKNFIKIDF